MILTSMSDNKEMTEKKTLYVYILTYNRAELLKETIASVLGQSYKDFSLFVLDNCSTDNTKEIVESFSDSRLSYIRHEENIGGAENFRFAIRHCDSDFFVIFHDDDQMLPNFLEDEMKVITQDESLSAVSANAEVFGAETGLLKHNADISKPVIFQGKDIFISYFRKGHFFIFPTLMYRTDFVKNFKIGTRTTVGPCGDIVMYFDIEKNGGKICELPNVVMRYRVHGEQDSVMHRYSMHIQLFNFFKNDEEYRDQFLAERKGRVNRFCRLSGHVFLDFLGRRMGFRQAKRYCYELAKSLAII